MSFISRGYLGLVAEPHSVMTGDTSLPGWLGLPVIINMASGAVLDIIREEDFRIVPETRITDINRILQSLTHVDTMDAVHDSVYYSDTVCTDIR
jgi:hypothetical protein